MSAHDNTQTAPMGLRFERTVSLGNLVTILLLVFGGGAAWQTMKSDVAATRLLIASADSRISAFERGAQEREMRIRSLELGASRYDEKLLNILASLDRIEQRLGGDQQ